MKMIREKGNIVHLPKKPLIEIHIENVTNRLSGFREGENQYHVSESGNSVATGDVEFPDQKFTVPFLRVDTGRTQMMTAEIESKKFTIALDFETKGKWVVNTDLLNSELPQPLFQIEPQTFFVI